MLEKKDFQPKVPPTNPAAERFVPKFIYCDPNDPTDIEIKEEFYGSRRKLRIGVLGAGISGINFLHHLLEKVPEESVEIVLYEQNKDVGGVWLTTTYDGCRCDSPSMTYQFPWRTNIWSEFHASQPEIRDYLQTVCRENDFYRYMRFQTEVVGASWTDEEAKWTLKVHDLAANRTFEDKVDVFVENDGCVSNPQITIPGVEAFKGEVMHTGRWRTEVDLQDKRVALLGYGCSGIQVAPNILPKVSKLYTWFRQRAYMFPSPYPEMAAEGGANFKWTESQKELLKDPDVYLTFMKMLDEGSCRRFNMNVNGTDTSKMAKEGITKFMKEKLKDKPEVFEKIVPIDYDVSCRRPTMSVGYLEALADPKTTVFEGSPKRFTERGFIDNNGAEHEIDIIIAATGYDQSHIPRYPKTVNGEDIATRWTKRGKLPTYMALAAEGMPNYFNPASTFAPLYRNWFQPSEAYGKYMAKVINKMQLERIVSFKPKTRAVDHFVKHANAFMQRMVQSGPCQAWYKWTDGRPALWPGSHSHYMQILEEPRFEDFDMVYEDEGDMFSYLGNGFALYPEGEEDADVTWYMGKPGREVGKEEVERLKGVYGEIQLPANLAEKRRREDEAKKGDMVRSSL